MGERQFSVRSQSGAVQVWQGHANGDLDYEEVHGAAEVAGRFLFFVYDPHVGVEPFVSDGTPNGTGLLKDLGQGDSFPSGFAVMGDRLAFILHR